MMSTHKQCLDIEQRSIEEENQEKQSEEDSNCYFLLDLKIPKTEASLGGILKTDNNASKLPKFGLLDMLEKVHDSDLRSQNPWLSPTASRIHWKAKSGKRVRFCTTEISSNCLELPWCQRKEDFVIKPGQLHAPNCRNSSYETADALGEYVWQNRVFLLADHMKRALQLHSSSHQTCGASGEQCIVYKESWSDE